MDVRLVAAALAGGLLSATASGQITVKGDPAKAIYEIHPRLCEFVDSVDTLLTEPSTEQPQRQQ